MIEIAPPTADTVRHPRGTWLIPDTGNPIAHRDLMMRMAERRVVLLGETHDIAEIHRWQLHILAALHLYRPNLAVAFEMFPRRLQPVLDAWIEGCFDATTFLQTCEWSQIWGFDPNLYFPLFHFCRQHRIRMVAMNCPRPLVSRVGREGWAAIPEDERDGVTPARPATDDHRRYLFDLIGAAGAQSRRSTRASIGSFGRSRSGIGPSPAPSLRPWPTGTSLVVGILGRGHVEYGHGTPFQLADLGIADVAVLLPTHADSLALKRNRGIADAVFRLDEPDPPQTARTTPPGRTAA
ncbi:ChaN family lipoprotein [Methylorubrum suomiense]